MTSYLSRILLYYTLALKRGHTYERAGVYRASIVYPSCHSPSTSGLWRHTENVDLVKILKRCGLEVLDVRDCNKHQTQAFGKEGFLTIIEPIPITKNKIKAQWKTITLLELTTASKCLLWDISNTFLISWFLGDARRED